MAAIVRLVCLALLSTWVTAAPSPAITPPPSLLHARSPDLGSYIDSAINSLGSGASSFFSSADPLFLSGFPTGTNVEKSASITDSDLAAVPTQVLNIPAYGNWTQNGWNVRLHGNVFKQPNISQDKIDDLANGFLIGTSIQDLPPDQQAQTRNLTREIYVVQQKNVAVKIDFVNDVAVRPDASGGAINAQGGAQTIQLPYNTTDEGDYDVFVPLQNTTGPNGGHLIPGTDTAQIQTLNIYAEGTDTGNATAYLVPPTGVTIVSDIDDILRVTKIWDPKEGILNSFARPFTPWLNMPDIYANWSKAMPDTHFHYLTTTPEQVTRNYMDFIYKTYPLGSFDTRPLNFSDVKATISIRRWLLDRVFQTFPERKFILVADTSNSDVMRDYPAMWHDYPGMVLCILLRNTTSTDSTDWIPYDTSGFKGIPQGTYMFFNVPDDLTNIDVAHGHCWNQSIAQNVTFDEQGDGLGNSGAAGVGTPRYTLGMVLSLFVVYWLL